MCGIFSNESNVVLQVTLVHVTDQTVANPAAFPFHLLAPSPISFINVFRAYFPYLSRVIYIAYVYCGSVAEWLACWTQAQKGPGSNRSRDAVGNSLRQSVTPIVPLLTKQENW